MRSLAFPIPISVCPEEPLSLSKRCPEGFERAFAKLSPSSGRTVINSKQLGDHARGVAHAVREAPFIVIPDDDANQLAFEPRSFVAVDRHRIGREPCREEGC